MFNDFGILGIPSLYDAHLDQINPNHIVQSLCIRKKPWLSQRTFNISTTEMAGHHLNVGQGRALCSNIVAATAGF